VTAEKTRRLGTRALAILAVCGSAAALTGLARSGPDAPLSQIVRLKAGTVTVERALATVADETGLQIVADLPSQDGRVTLAEGARAASDVLGEVAESMDAVPLSTHGSVVLRPNTYPTVDQPEKAYRSAMQGLVSFMEELPATRRDTIADEEWLDVASLPRGQQQRLRAALLDDDPSDEVWRQWAREGKIAAGFLFDPYVQIDGVQGVPGERWFVRTRHRLPAYDRLVPAKRPGAVRPASQEGR